MRRPWHVHQSKFRAGSCNKQECRVSPTGIAPLRLLVALLILRHLNWGLVSWLSMMDGIDIDIGIFLKQIPQIALGRDKKTYLLTFPFMSTSNIAAYLPYTDGVGHWRGTGIQAFLKMWLLDHKRRRGYPILAAHKVLGSKGTSPLREMFFEIDFSSLSILLY